MFVHQSSQTERASECITFQEESMAPQEESRMKSFTSFMGCHHSLSCKIISFPDLCCSCATRKKHTKRKEKVDEGFKYAHSLPDFKWTKEHYWQPRALLILFVLVVIATDWLPTCTANIFDSEGPQFTSEPSRLNYFTNVQSLILHCTARGSPTPGIQWITQKNGQHVESVIGSREVFPNGSLYFPPFPVSSYRPDVHDTVYVCIAANSVGKVRSRDIHVRAVINQQFDVRAESSYTSIGNDALLRCLVPDPVKDFVSVTSWIKDSTYNIFPPHSGGGGRYFMAPSGELLIEDVSRNDSSSTFRCRTVNRLTDQTQLSENSARLQLKGGGGGGSASPLPKIVSRVPTVRLKEGDVGVIFCLSEGHPPPKNGWFKVQSYGSLEPLRPSDRIRIRQSVVVFESVVASDSGTYLCTANNTGGSDKYSVEVIVTKPLEVQLAPTLLTVDIGTSAEFTCWTNRAFDLLSSSSSSGTISSSSSSGSNMLPSALSQLSSVATVTWRKDGVEIRPSLRTSFSTYGEKLRVSTVQREDKGMYQCFVKSDMDMAQASAELRLGDSHPQFIYRFIEQTLRPGTPVSIKCSATGNPTPQITWLLDGFTLPHSERLLIGQYVTLNGDVVSHVNITSTRVEDGGEFVCIASNKMGSATHSARLNIYGSPFVRNMPGTITAVAGKAFHLKCPVAGYPITGITWHKEEQLLPYTIRQSVSPNGTLTIKDVDRSVDSGWYSCSASNKQGSSNRRGVHINVVVPPKLAPFSFPESPREGERILTMCGVSDGDPPVRLEWLKDSLPISNSGNGSSSSASDVSTHQMSDFGVLALQIPHVTWNDTGNYSCVARNSAGHASLTLPLVVHVPPRIAPYSFPSPVSQGSRVQVVCSVEQGDIEETNLTVTWLKDSEPLRPGSSPLISSSSPTSLGSNAKVMEVDAYSAILIIERVDWERDSGNYTCRISNSVDEVHKTNELVVRVPPKWVDEPKDGEILEGKSLQISCQARGFPGPKISWRKAIGDRPENFRDIPVISSEAEFSSPFGGFNSPYSQLEIGDVLPSKPFYFSNGTLQMRAIRRSNQGYYLCEASNGIGSGLSKVIRLTVNVPVRVKEPNQNVSASVGANVSLRCDLVGDLPLVSVGWKKGTTEVTTNDSRFQARVFNYTGGQSVSGLGGSGTSNAGSDDAQEDTALSAFSTVSELTVTNVGREDSARYVCFAANRHGESQGVIWLHVQEPPDVPRNLHVIAKGSRFARLGWILTQGGNSQLTQFIIRFKPVQSSGELQELHVSGSLFSETIRNLRPATAYSFTIIAENQVGRSQPSERLELKTDGEAPEGKARNIRVAAVSSSDIQVTWEHPPRETWHGQLLGYYVGFRKYREGEQYQFSTIERKELSLQEFLITSLAAFTSYEVVVQAYNGIGTGPMSDSMLITTLEDVPSGYPEGILCTPLTSDTLQLTWSPVTGELARGLITGYRVSLELVDIDSLVNEDVPLSRTTPTNAFIFNSLAKYTNYSVHVQAFTSIGTGPPSPPIYCRTDEDVPNVPEAIKAVVSSSSSITVSWLPPSQPNGQLTKYSVYFSAIPELSGRRDGSLGLRKNTVSPDTNKLQLEGLRPDEKYEFRVSASTKVGEGPFVATQKIHTKTVVSSIISFGQDLRVIWKTDVRLVCEAVGNSIIQWTKFTELVQKTNRIAFHDDGALSIHEVKREDSGNFTCTLMTTGNSIESITYRLTVQVPPMAPLMTASGTSYNTVNLQWKLSDSGGAPVKGFMLHVKAADEWIEKRISRHLSAYELQGLECGTYYQMYLTAYNRAGMGHASELSNVSTMGSVPSLTLSSPEYMVQTNKSVTRVLLKEIWSDNGCKIRWFRVFFKSTDSSRWQTAGGGDLDGETRGVDILGLKASSQFHIRVEAVNSAGLEEIELTINTPDSEPQSTGANVETSTNAMNHLQTTPFYLDAKLIGPIVLSLIALIAMSVSACICYRKKSPVDGQSNQNLSVGSPTSSLYFKHNPNHTLLQHHHHQQQQHVAHPSIRGGPQQVYMTVKKATPMKGVDMTDIQAVPQYNDDIYPYATFEVNEQAQMESRSCKTLGGHTLDRNRHSRHHQRTNSGQERMTKFHSPLAHQRPASVDDESEEYDSVGSDSDYREEPFQHLSYPHKTHQVNDNSHFTSSIRGGTLGKKDASVLRKTSQKYQDYESRARCGNHYELGPQTGVTARQQSCRGLTSQRIDV